MSYAALGWSYDCPCVPEFVEYSGYGGLGYCGYGAAAELSYVETVTGPDGQPYDRVSDADREGVLVALASFNQVKRLDDGSSDDRIFELTRSVEGDDVLPELEGRGVALVGDVMTAPTIQAIQTKTLATVRRLGGYALNSPQGGWATAPAGAAAGGKLFGLSTNALLVGGAVGVVALAALVVARRRRSR